MKRNNKLTEIQIVLFAFILALNGCNKEKRSDNDLLNTKWKLVHISNNTTNGLLYFPVNTDPITIIFRDSMNIIVIDGICNSGTGTWSNSPKSREIKISNLKTTLIACDFVEWEGYTVQGLLGATRYEMTDNSLIIYSDSDFDLHFNRSP